MKSAALALHCLRKFPLTRVFAGALAVPFFSYPALAQHEVATSAGVGLSIPLTMLPRQGMEPAEQATSLVRSGVSTAEKAIFLKNGEHAPRKDLDKALILGGAEAFPI